MGRPSKKTLFLKELLKDIETEPTWEEYKLALYKEYILHLTTGEPRWIYDTIIKEASSYWDYMLSKDPTYTKEELLTDMGDVVDTPLVLKSMESIKDTLLLKLK